MTETPSKKRAPRTKRAVHACTYEVHEAAMEVSDALFKKMHGWLDVLCELRETFRQHRIADRAVGRVVRDSGQKHKYVTKADQYILIKELCLKLPALKAVHSQVRQDVADRLDRGNKEWLKKKRGPLAYKPRSKFRSFNFTQYGTAVKIRNGRLHMSGLGEARLLGLRKLPGRVKSVNIVFKQGRFFAQFTCEIQLQHCKRHKRHSSEEVQRRPDTGLDTGLSRMATLADGKVFEPAKPLKKALPALQAAQRQMSRQFEHRKKAWRTYKAAFRKGWKANELFGPPCHWKRCHLEYSNRLRRQIRKVAILHTKVTNTRLDSIRKAARQIEQRYGCVAVEEHGIEFMKKNKRLARTVSDVAPGLFKQTLKNVLGELRYHAVPNKREGIGGNSQTCLCGESVKKTLSDRWHECPRCGLSADRDLVSANIAMDIAFGESNLGDMTLPGSGQDLVKRVGSECTSRVTARAARKAPELSSKRKPRLKPADSNQRGAHGLPAVQECAILPSERAA